jgi:PAS domain S-box-containing protein
MVGGPADNAAELARKLAEREVFIRSFFEKSPVGLNLCTMEGLWLESNDAFLAMIGYTHEEADGGLTYWQLTPRSYDAQEQVQLQSLRTTGRYGPYEKEFIRKDGSLVPVRLNGFLLERDGKQYIWSLIEDMSKERERERTLKLERLKALHSAKLATLGEMAASIVHEISNPLVVIEAWASQLEDIFARGSPALRAEAVRDMRAAVERTGKIIRNLKRFSRDSAVDPHARVPLRTIAENAVDLCRIRLRHADVTLILSVEDGLDVEGVAVELEQVVVNLVNNAADAVQGAEVREVSIGSRVDGDWVELRVEDSGPGIAPGMLERIFDPFFTTKKPGEGTGLGLSISRSIAERHGGTLSWQSAPRSTFVLRLPRAK